MADAKRCAVCMYVPDETGRCGCFEVTFFDRTIERLVARFTR